MLLGVHTGLHDAISVQEIGIDNITAADGLAVGRASGFVGRAMERLIDGYYTIDDAEMYNLLGLLDQTEAIRLEPSALAGMPGCVHVTRIRRIYRLNRWHRNGWRMPHIWSGQPAAAWFRKMRCRNIYHRPKVTDRAVSN